MIGVRGAEIPGEGVRGAQIPGEGVRGAQIPGEGVRGAQIPSRNKKDILTNVKSDLPTKNTPGIQ